MYSAIMKQKVIRIIKRLIGHRILVHPIVDANVYDANENSFSGNSLQDSNVLIVGCDETLMRSGSCFQKRIRHFQAAGMVSTCPCDHAVS